LAYDVEAHQFRETLEIVGFQLDAFAEIFIRCVRLGSFRREAFFGDDRGYARFDVFSDFRESGAGIGAGELQSVILRGVVAGGEIDGAIKFTALNFVGDSGGRSEGIAEKRFDAVFLQHVHG
jgi:hypothetical protein